MPRAAPKTAIPAEENETGETVVVAADPGNGFDDLRRHTDQVVDTALPGDPAPEPVKAKEDPDLEAMTKSMRARLMRQRRETERLVGEKEAEFQGRLTEQNKRIAELEKRLAGSATPNAMEDLQAEMEAALEKGDSKKVAEINARMVETSVARRTHSVDEPEDLDAEDPAQKTPGKPAANLPRVQQWLDGQEWWEDPDHAHIRNFVAKKVDSKLQAAGYSPKEDDYYTELERILEEKFPGVVVKTSGKEDKFSKLLDDDDDVEIKPKGAAARRSAPRAPVMAGDDGADRGSGDERPRPKGSVRLSADEVATMRRFGLDPRNPKHVKGYIDNRGSENE